MRRRVLNSRSTNNNENRSGVTLVENALVISILGIFFTGILEFGHGYMVQATLNAAAQRTARYASVDGITTARAREYAQNILSKSIKSKDITIQIKDGAVFDSYGFNASTIKYTDLPDAELNDFEDNQLFIVRIAIPYRQVALLPPFWTKSITIQAVSVMRHE